WTPTCSVPVPAFIGLCRLRDRLRQAHTCASTYPNILEMRRGRVLTVPPSGGWKAARTRTLESVRYVAHVAQPFQAAGSRSFTAPQRAPARVESWREYQHAPMRRMRRGSG